MSSHPKAKEGFPVTQLETLLVPEMKNADKRCAVYAAVTLVSIIDRYFKIISLFIAVFVAHII
jgi:hypothetical protein